MMSTRWWSLRRWKMKKWSECLLHLPWFSSWSVCQRRSWKPTCLGIFARFLNTTVCLHSEKFDDQLCCIYSIFSLVLSVHQCRNDGIFSVMQPLIRTWSYAQFDVYICSIFLKVCVHLRSRFQEIRDVARNTLVKIIETLGHQYLHYLLSEMQAVLVKGYQVKYSLY